MPADFVEQRPNLSRQRPAFREPYRYQADSIEAKSRENLLSPLLPSDVDGQLMDGSRLKLRSDVSEDPERLRKGMGRSLRIGTTYFIGSPTRPGDGYLEPKLHWYRRGHGPLGVGLKEPKRFLGQRKAEQHCSPAGGLRQRDKAARPTG